MLTLRNHSRRCSQAPGHAQHALHSPRCLAASQSYAGVSCRREVARTLSPAGAGMVVQPQLGLSRRRAPVALRARGSGSATTEPWWNKDTTPNMLTINSVQELVDGLAEHSDKLVIVDYYAPWCGSCRALYPKLCQLMAANSDTMVLLKVDFEQNKALAKGLGVKVLPYFQFYRGAEGRVDAFAASVTKIQRLKDALETHGVPFCSLAAPPDLEEFPEVHAHALLAPQARGEHPAPWTLDLSRHHSTATEAVAEAGARPVGGTFDPEAEGWAFAAKSSYMGSQGDLSLVGSVDAADVGRDDAVVTPAAEKLAAAVAAATSALRSA